VLRSVRPNRPSREHSDSRSRTGWDSGYPGRLAPINGAEVLRLQRVLGNQALTTLLRASPPGTAADRIVVQRRRGQFPEDILIRADLRDFGYPEDKADKLPAAGLQGHANRVFDENAANGRRYWDGLHQTATRYRDQQQRPRLIAELEERQQDYDRRYTEHYEHYEHYESGKSLVWSKAGDPENPVPVPYANRLESDGNAHTLVAEKNYAEYDRAPVPGKLNNSEILWQQYKALRKQALERENDNVTPQTEAEDLRKLHQVERNNVVNPETIVTFYCSYETGVPPTDLKHWAPGAEEFLALLGTENLRGVTYLLKDHMNQLGKTIRRVSTKKDGAKVMIWIDLVDL
jgi:hypothetical protein